MERIMRSAPERVKPYSPYYQPTHGVRVIPELEYYTELRVRLDPPTRSAKGGDSIGELVMCVAKRKLFSMGEAARRVARRSMTMG